MSASDVRKGFTNARFNEKNSNILFLEILLIAVAAGVEFESWWVFGGTLLALSVALYIRAVAIPFMVILSVFWGLFGYSIGVAADSIAASVVLGIIAFLMGIGVHFSALQWAKDIET